MRALISVHVGDSIVCGGRKKLEGGSHVVDIE